MARGISDKGHEPVREWLKSLEAADRKAVGEDLVTVQWGWPVGMPLCGPMGDGLWEVRTALGSRRIARVLFCFHAGVIVALHGFIKKTQKTPDQDLQLARKRAKRGESSMNQSLGSSLDDFLKEEDVFEETQAQAIKRVIAWQLGETMKRQNITKTQMAAMMQTSRSQIDRLLDPKSDVTITSLQKAAALVGKRVHIELDRTTPATPEGLAARQATDSGP